MFTTTLTFLNTQQTTVQKNNNVAVKIKEMKITHTENTIASYGVGPTLVPT